MHFATEYERIIHEWCCATGMTPWRIEEDMSILLGRTEIGLVYHADDAPHVLQVFAELGLEPAPVVQERLLQLNCCAAPDGGVYGLHPETGHVVYRMAIPLVEQTNGADLPAHISRCVDAALTRVLL